MMFLSEVMQELRTCMIEVIQLKILHGVEYKYIA
jgi:hypothetical protein